LICTGSTSVRPSHVRVVLEEQSAATSEEFFVCLIQALLI
jgi:hypothetical protein